jgi:hypothetical protein
MEIAADSTDHDVSSIQPDADLHGHAMAALHLGGVLLHRGLHGQGGIAGPHRMVLMRQGRTKQRHDAITHDLVHGAFVAMHGVHHALQHRIEELAGLLRVTVRQQLHRAFQIGKEHGHLLALAFQGAAGGEDFLREIRWGVGERCLGRGLHGSSRASTHRASGIGPDQPSTRVVVHLRLRVEEFVLQGRELLVI